MSNSPQQNLYAELLSRAQTHERSDAGGTTQSSISLRDFRLPLLIGRSDPFFDIYQMSHSVVRDSEQGLQTQLPLKGEKIAGHCSSASNFAAAILLTLYKVRAQNIFIHQLSDLLPKCNFEMSANHVIVYVKNGGNLIGKKGCDIFFDPTSLQFNGKQDDEYQDQPVNWYKNLCSFGDQGKQIARELLCSGYVPIPQNKAGAHKLTLLLASFQENIEANKVPSVPPLDINIMYQRSPDDDWPGEKSELKRKLEMQLNGAWEDSYYSIEANKIISPRHFINFSGSRDRNQRNLKKPD